MSDFNNRSNDRRSAQNKSSGWKNSGKRDSYSREQGRSDRNNYGKKRFWSADDDNRCDRDSRSGAGFQRSDSNTRNKRFGDRERFGNHERGRNYSERNRDFSSREDRFTNPEEKQNTGRRYRDFGSRGNFGSHDRDENFANRGENRRYSDGRGGGYRKNRFRDNDENSRSEYRGRNNSEHHGGRRRFERESHNDELNRFEEKRHNRDSKIRNHNEDRQRRAESQRLQDEIPASITSDSLDAQTRMHLRSLNRENAEVVARHLAYAGEMMDLDPEVAYRHSKAAFQRAARVDVVREALGLTAYVTGRYSEALSELRTYRRMSDDYTHVPIEADAERGMGRSEKALQFIAGVPLARLNPEAKVELAIVASGARADLGDFAGGLKSLEKIKTEFLSPELAARVQLVRADRLSELGREEEAQALRDEWEAEFTGADLDQDLVLDLDDVLDDLPVSANSSRYSEELEAELESDVDDYSQSGNAQEADNNSGNNTNVTEEFDDVAEDDIDEFDEELEAALNEEFADEDED